MSIEFIDHHMKGHEFRRHRKPQCSFSWESPLLHAELCGDSCSSILGHVRCVIAGADNTDLPGIQVQLPLLGLLMSCTTDMPWQRRQMGLEEASWTQGWGGSLTARMSTEEHLSQSSIALWVWTTNQQT